MRLVRFETKDQGPQFGWEDGGRVGSLEGSPFADFRRGEAILPIEAVKLLPPVEPTKIICVGRNYPAHAAEHGVEVPQIPLLFFKPPSSLLAPFDPILLPRQSTQVEHEAELAVVIGKRGRWIEPENAASHIFGYTIANDVTARDLQRKDGQWTRGKGFDTFCPLGPWIDSEFDAADAVISCRVNGDLRQMGSARDMVFPIPRLIAFITTIMTLLPGDVILTGTPSGVGALKPGDSMETAVEGLGSLTNPVLLEG